MAAFRQLSGQKFDPESLLSLWNFALIFGQQISILDSPLTLDFLVHLGLNFHPMGELRWREVGPSADTFFCHGQKRDYLSRAS